MPALNLMCFASMVRASSGLQPVSHMKSRRSPKAASLTSSRTFFHSSSENTTSRRFRDGLLGTCATGFSRRYVFSNRPFERSDDGADCVVPSVEFHVSSVSTQSAKSAPQRFAIFAFTSLGLKRRARGRLCSRKYREFTHGSFRH